jgi:hypothetical protein
MSLTESACNVVSLIGSTPQNIAPAKSADDGWEIAFEAQAGLYQLSVLVDASKFDWETLYFISDLHGNNNARTGPWDFDWRNKNTPLVPTYRVTVDGKYIGLWFFQRVSIPDIENKRFRGRMAMWLQTPGKHTLKLVPYRAIDIQWLSATLEADPEDSLKPLAAGTKDACEVSPYAKWRDPKFWAAFKARLGTFEPAIKANFEDAAAELVKGGSHVSYLPAVIASYKYLGGEAAKEKLVKTLEAVTKQQYYGNPTPDGYSHNGDFGAAYTLYGMSVALHAIPDELGKDLIEQIKAKLTLQGNIFIDLMLLNRDYWGGSVIQDHGWKSAFGFAAAALNLRGMLPEADRWLQYILPRAERGLDAMPRDGFLPSGSYNSTWQHSDPIAMYQELSAAITGVDPLDRPEVIACGHTVYEETLLHNDRPWLPGTLGDPMPIYGGGRLYARLAAKHKDSKAQWVAYRSMTTTLDYSYHDNVKQGYYENRVLTPLSYDPAVAVAGTKDRPGIAMYHYKDSAVVIARDDAQGLILSAQVGPWSGYHAYRYAQGPCDRMGMSPTPGDGHFSLTLDGKLILCSPDSGYKLTSIGRTCMLVDGKGQYGDIGYPMSIPSFEQQGQEIEFGRFDEASQTAHTRFKLAPSYTKDQGVLIYTRELILKGKTLTVRERFVFDKPRSPSWLFHVRETDGIAWNGISPTLAGKIKISPATTVGLTGSTQPTPVVYSYASASGRAKFIHARFDAKAPVREGVVDFVMTW